MYYAYVDTTDDGRVFYVGMGDDRRLARRLGRNRRHTHTAKKHGLNRCIIATFCERQEAIDLEIKLIAEHHTFVDDTSYNGIGCNYTKGGEGCPCSEETRRKISESRKGTVPWNKGKHGLTYNVSEENRQKAREQRIAFNKTKPMLGKHHSEEAKARMRKPHICSICQTLGHTKTTCPKRQIDAVNQVQVAQRLRHQNEP